MALKSCADSSRPVEDRSRQACASPPLKNAAEPHLGWNWRSTDKRAIGAMARRSNPYILPGGKPLLRGAPRCAMFRSDNKV